VAQRMQQQPTYIHDLRELCERSSHPCERDTTTTEIKSSVFGLLRISRCAAGDCGQLFIEQVATQVEQPLHVLRRQDALFADICWNTFRIALEQEGREVPIKIGEDQPVVLDL
jgi:hypothetical protein